MSELQADYAERVSFVVVPAEETALRGDEIEEYGFTDLRHGLVTFSCSRAVVVKLPGHQFGKDEIRAAVEATLVAD